MFTLAPWSCARLENAVSVADAETAKYQTSTQNTTSWPLPFGHLDVLTWGHLRCLKGILADRQKRCHEKAPPAQGHKALGIQIPGSERLEPNETHQTQLSCRNSCFCCLATLGAGSTLEIKMIKRYSQKIPTLSGPMNIPALKPFFPLPRMASPHALPFKPWQPTSPCATKVSLFCCDING